MMVGVSDYSSGALLSREWCKAGVSCCAVVVLRCDLLLHTRSASKGRREKRFAEKAGRWPTYNCCASVNNFFSSTQRAGRLQVREQNRTYRCKDMFTSQSYR